MLAPTNWAFACKTETLGSLYRHAVLIPTKSFKSKNQVKFKQKFVDPLSTTCQLSSERRVLDFFVFSDDNIGIIVVCL